jgi:N-methylhydantoinase A/oxoprolinase/acetone carboxylase beta subunit
LERLLDRIADEARRLLPAEAHPQLSRFADMRYSGQDHTLEVSLPTGSIDEAAIAKTVDAFIKQYLDLYGKIDDDNPVEIASVRVVLTQAGANLKLPTPKSGAPSLPFGRRRIFGSGGVFAEAPVFQRSTLTIGQQIAGPALIEERESTTVLDEGDRLTLDAIGALVIDVGLLHRSEELPHQVAAGV